MNHYGEELHVSNKRNIPKKGEENHAIHRL